MMRSVLVVLAAVAATVISAGPVAAKEVGKPPAAALAAKLRLATPLDGAARVKGLHRADGRQAGRQLQGRDIGIRQVGG